MKALFVLLLAVVVLAFHPLPESLLRVRDHLLDHDCCALACDDWDFDCQEEFDGYLEDLKDRLDLWKFKYSTSQSHDDRRKREWETRWRLQRDFL